MPLYSSPSSSKPVISPQKYSWLFCKHISSKIIHTPLEIFPSIRNAFAHLTALMIPLLIFCSNDKDGNGKSWSKTLYDWIEMCIFTTNYILWCWLGKWAFSYICTEVTPQISKNDCQRMKFLGILESSLACFFLLDDNQYLGENTVVKALDSLWKRALYLISCQF